MDRLHEVGNPKTCPVVAIVRGRKLLIGLRHYTPDKWQEISVWTLPGGRCDEGEPVEQALRREVKEETGITDLNFIGYMGTVPGAKAGDTVFIFAATTKEEPQLLEPEKFSEWRWADIDAMPGAFINPAALQLIRANLL